MAFRIFDVGLVLPVLTDKQTAVNRLFAINGVHFFFRYFAYPGCIFQIEIVVVHREECIDVPFVPFLTNHPFRMRIGAGENGCADFLAFGVHRIGNAIDQLGDQVAAELCPFFTVIIEYFYLQI